MARAGLTDLILIKLWVLRLWLEGDYNEANKDVDNEEGDDNDVEEVEKCNVCPMVFFWSQVNLSWVYRGIEKPGQRKVFKKTTSFKEDIKERNVPRPPLKCGSDKECEHGLNNVVKVEAVTLPGVVPSGC